MAEEKDVMSFIRLGFSDYKLPKFEERKTDDIISYGEKNDYPQKLIEYYRRSAIHGAIVRQTANMIRGKETVPKEPSPALDAILKKVNKYESLQTLKGKIALDYKLFRGFALEIVYNNAGKPVPYHMDFSKIRTLDHDTYYYNKFFGAAGYKKSDNQPFKRYNPATAKPGDRQIFYYRGYDAGMDVYPLPDYHDALQYIGIDVEIANFHDSNIRNGFMGGTMIQFFKGEPPPDEMRKLVKKFKGQYTGTDNAGGVLFVFSNPGETPADVKILTPSEFDKQFLQLKESVQDSILIGHMVTDPSLFGVRVPQPGISTGTEKMLSFEIFQKTYLQYAQADIDGALSQILTDMGYPCELTTVTEDIIGQDYRQLYLDKIVSLSTAQKELGVPVEPVDAPVQEFEEKEAEWSDDDLSVFEKFGEPEDNFDVIHFQFAAEDDEKKIMAVIKGDPKLSVKQISKATSIAEKEVAKILSDLEGSGKIKWSDNAIKITDGGGIPEIEIRYKYALAPEAKPLVPGGESRPFCQKMMDMGRVYTREEIDQLSSILKYDVWKRRGGWYHVPGTELNLPHCRHEWQQRIVRRKNG